MAYIYYTHASIIVLSKIFTQYSIFYFALDCLLSFRPLGIQQLNKRLVLRGAKEYTFFFLLITEFGEWSYRPLSIIFFFFCFKMYISIGLGA